jgi:hypothetical protein
MNATMPRHDRGSDVSSDYYLVRNPTTKEGPAGCRGHHEGWRSRKSSVARLNVSGSS